MAKQEDLEFERLPLDVIEDFVIDGENLSFLYRIDTFLDKKRSRLYIDIANVGLDKNAKNKIKSELSWTENLHRICCQRELDLREDNARYNWRFRVAAERYLDETTYNLVADKARTI